MAIKWLDAKRLQGTNAERLAMTTTETKSVDFDGTTDSVTAGGSASTYGFLTGNTTGTGDFSIACWIKPTPTTQAVLFDSFGYDGSNSGFGARWDSDGTLNVGIADGSGFPTVSSGAIFSTGAWQHLIITYDSGTMKIYRNGTQAVSGSVASTNNTPYGVLKIGEANDSQDNEYQGYMSDLLLTDDVLSADEISALASGTTVDNVSPTIDNQELHYTFFTDFTDSSGQSGRNGTASGATINTDGGTLPLTSTYPNLPNGTIFNETDAYKYFMFDGTDTWNQMVSS